MDLEANDGLRAKLEIALLSGVGHDEASTTPLAVSIDQNEIDSATATPRF